MLFEKHGMKTKRECFASRLLSAKYGSLLLFVGNDKFEALSAQYGVMFPNLFHE